MNQNYPNPFNGQTVITFHINETISAKLNLYNINGELVSTLTNGVFQPGIYQVRLSGNILSSGIYFYELITQKNRGVKSLILLK